MKSFKKNVLLILIGVISVSCSNDKNDCFIDTSLETASSRITQISENRHSVYTDIVINASSEEVWAVLTDFDKMPNWSSSFQGLKGNISNGGKVIATFIFPDPVSGIPTLGNYPHTLIYSKGVEFGWTDPILGFEGISDNHFYRVERISNCQTRFVQKDEFSGTSPNISTEILANIVLQSYNQFNIELKKEVEK